MEIYIILDCNNFDSDVLPTIAYVGVEFDVATDYRYV